MSAEAWGVACRAVVEELREVKDGGGPVRVNGQVVFESDGRR